VEQPQIKEKRVEATTQANHTKKAGKGAGKLKDLCKMRGRMWVLLQFNAGREGH